MAGSPQLRPRAYSSWWREWWAGTVAAVVDSAARQLQKLLGNRLRPADKRVSPVKPRNQRCRSAPREAVDSLRRRTDNALGLVSFPNSSTTYCYVLLGNTTLRGRRRLSCTTCSSSMRPPGCWCSQPRVFRHLHEGDPRCGSGRYEILCIPLPAEMQAEADEVKRHASREVSPTRVPPSPS